MPKNEVPDLRILSGGSRSLAQGFDPGDHLHVVREADDLHAGAVLPVLGFRRVLDRHRRTVSMTAYTPGRQIEATQREHLRFPAPLATESIFNRMLPVCIREIEVDVYVEALLLEPAAEARVLSLFPDYPANAAA